MFGERLRILRLEKNITQKQLSETIGIGRTTYAKYETNERQPDFLILCKLADHFEVSTDYILGRSNIRNNKLINEIKTDPHSKYFDEIIKIIKKNIKSIDFIYLLLKCFDDNNKL